MPLPDRGDFALARGFDAEPVLDDGHAGLELLDIAAHEPEEVVEARVEDANLALHLDNLALHLDDLALHLDDLALHLDDLAAHADELGLNPFEDPEREA